MSDMRNNEDEFGEREQEGGNTGENETDAETDGEIDEVATEESSL